jgi:hypothetical protein
LAQLESTTEKLQRLRAAQAEMERPFFTGFAGAIDVVEMSRKLPLGEFRKYCEISREVRHLQRQTPTP